MLTIPSYPSASPFHAVCHLLPSASPSYVVNHLLPNWKSLCTVNSLSFTSFQLQVSSMLSIPSYPAASPFHASCQSSLCGQQMSIPSMLSPAVNPFYAVTSCQSILCCHKQPVPSMLSPAASPSMLSLAVNPFYAVNSCPSLLCMLSPAVNPF